MTIKELISVLNDIPNKDADIYIETADNYGSPIFNYIKDIYVDCDDDVIIK